MASLEKKIQDIMSKKRKQIAEDKTGVVSTSQHVTPDYEDLGPAQTSPFDGKTEWAGPITPGQASLPTMHPTPAVGTVGGGYTPNTVKEEEEVAEEIVTEEKPDFGGDDDDDDDKDDKDGDKDEVKEDRTAADENAQQKAKYASADPMKSVKDPAGSSVAKEEIEEDVNCLFVGENLTEAFKKKATTLYEAAVNQRVNMIVEAKMAELEEAYQAAFETQVNELQESLETRVDSYLNYVVEQWMEANTIAIDKGLKADLTEDFILGLKNLFTEHYIEIPAEKVDVLNTLAEKVEDMETRLNEQLERNVNLSEQNRSLLRQQAITEARIGLTVAEGDKLQKLAESVEFKDESSFKEALTTLRESKLVSTTPAKPKAQNLTEEAEPVKVPARPVGDVAQALEALKRSRVL